MRTISLQEIRFSTIYSVANEYVEELGRALQVAHEIIHSNLIVERNKRNATRTA
jgi:hypothetical protein